MRFHLWHLAWFFWTPMIVAIIAAAVLLSQSEQSSSAPPVGPYGGSAEQILRERFARGEISKEEFEQRLATLRSTAR